jgi:hypothetical protein
MVNLIPSGNHIDYDPHRAHSEVIMDDSGIINDSYKDGPNGFPLATKAAVEQAKRQLIRAIQAENEKIVSANNPTGVSRSIDGVDAAPDSAIEL